MQLDQFLDLVRTRRAVRHFRPDPVPSEVLEAVLEAARWAPSGYNLQPTSFVVVTDPSTRESLCEACLGQPQVCEAPVVIVLAADTRADRNNLDAVLDRDLAAGAIDEEYAGKVRQGVTLMFARGPFGLGRLLARVVLPLIRLFRPVPSFPSVEGRAWAARQAMLPAMNLMLAAHAAGLATVPMEGFDEARVRNILGIPRSCAVPLLIPVGFAAPGELVKTRLPMDRLVHPERW